VWIEPELPAPRSASKRQQFSIMSTMGFGLWPTATFPRAVRTSGF
jgi:hypothetical protein